MPCLTPVHDLLMSFQDLDASAAAAVQAAADAAAQAEARLTQSLEELRNMINASGGSHGSHTCMMYIMCDIMCDIWQQLIGQVNPVCGWGQLCRGPPAHDAF
jgi:hypothetical protein